MRIFPSMHFLPLVLLCSCGTTVEYVRLQKAPHKLYKKSIDQVEIFTAKAPDREFVELGIFEAYRQSSFAGTGTGEFIQAMRVEAAERGCDAVVLTGSADQTEYIPFAREHTLPGIRGTCIIYK
jgi:hypothetical protein